MLLSDAACRTAKPIAATITKLSDGRGLQLWVHPNGSKLWRLAYRFGRKQKLLSLGPYPTVSLSDAREEREKAKKLLLKAIDPSEARKSAKAEQLAMLVTFRSIAEELLALQTRNGRAEVTLEKTKWLLEFAYPTLGNKPVTEIRPPEILNVLRGVESRGRYETARRLRSTIGRVFRFAVATGRAENDPTSALQGTLATPPAKSHAAITHPKAFGAMLRAIDGFDGQGTTLAGLKLMSLLFPRPGELRAAEWTEFDTDKAVWTIPAERTKLRRAHKVPLSRQALVVLSDLRRITGHGRLAFPSVRTTTKPISENTLNAALRRLGYGNDEATSHGFRASAATLLNETGRWSADAIERQLAHIERNDVRRAYTRGEHWDERVRMIQWWADYLDHLKQVGKIISMGPNGHRVSSP
jgi:integrase